MFVTEVFCVRSALIKQSAMVVYFTFLRYCFLYFSFAFLLFNLLKKVTSGANEGGTSTTKIISGLTIYETVLLPESDLVSVSVARGTGVLIFPNFWLFRMIVLLKNLTFLCSKKIHGMLILAIACDRICASMGMRPSFTSVVQHLLLLVSFFEGNYDFVSSVVFPLLFRFTERNDSVLRHIVC